MSDMCEGGGPPLFRTAKENIMNPIKKGISTWAGIIASIVALAPPAANQIIAFLENAQAHWSGAEKTSLIAGGVILLVTIGGRFAQAVAAILKGADL